jgi:hypothetical protein
MHMNEIHCMRLTRQNGQDPLMHQHHMGGKPPTREKSYEQQRLRTGLSFVPLQQRRSLGLYVMSKQQQVCTVFSLISCIA